MKKKKPRENYYTSSLLVVGGYGRGGRRCPYESAGSIDACCAGCGAV
jgi:hypothetical protein